MQWSRPLSASQVIGVMSDEGRGLFRGLYFGAETRHGVLDIDVNSRYHNLDALAELAGEFTSIGLPLVAYQSSDSGGWHLYFFFDDWAPSHEVETTIKAWLKSFGYVLQSGTLEIFPSGNALRLPLQQGFAWLSPDGKVKRKREEIGKDEALASFLLDLEENKRDWSEAKNRIKSQISNLPADAGAGKSSAGDITDDEGFEGLFRGGLDWEKYQRGRDYWLSGLTDKSQRHDAVICIGHYLWYGDKASGLLPLPHPRNARARAAKIEAWLETNHNGQSRAVNAGQWSEVSSQIDRATSWTRQTPLVTEKYEPYPLTDRLIKRLEWLYQKTGKLWTVEELEKANIDRSLDARHRIAVAVAQLDAQGELITKAAVARRAKASRNTVGKNGDLLTCCSGVYNGGAGGSLLPLCSLQLVPDSSLSSITSPIDRPQQEFIPLPSSGSESVSPGPLKVAPLLSCLASEPITGAQRKDQALRVPAEVLTPGPTPGDFQALRHETAGGISLFDPECYTNATRFSTGVFEGQSSGSSAGILFWSGRKNKETDLDATNYSRLTSVQHRMESQSEDKIFSVIPVPELRKFSVCLYGRAFRRSCRAPPKLL